MSSRTVTGSGTEEKPDRESSKAEPEEAIFKEPTASTATATVSKSGGGHLPRLPLAAEKAAPDDGSTDNVEKHHEGAVRPIADGNLDP
jgi:hypothetical protein